MHNLIGDLGEITGKMRSTPSTATLGEVTTKPRKKITRCSALVKPTSDDIFISQVDWDDYDTGLLKVMKDYTLPYESDTVHHVRFSSYPGIIYSFDGASSSMSPLWLHHCHGSTIACTSLLL